MAEFQQKHFFGPNGQLHNIHGKQQLHSDFVYENPKLFGFKDAKHVASVDDSNDDDFSKLYDRVATNGFIRGEYDQIYDGEHGTIHTHYLSHESPKDGTILKFKKALETLHGHYSKHPNRKFEIHLVAHNWNDDSKIVDTIRKTTGGDSAITSLEHIEKIAGIEKNKPTTRPVKKISRREIENKINTSALGREVRMGQGDMTTAEWNFWRRKGLGDSYMPLNSDNVQLIKEHLYTKLIKF
jgi:hypothetical protein